MTDVRGAAQEVLALLPAGFTHTHTDPVYRCVQCAPVNLLTRLLLLLLALMSI